MSRLIPIVIAVVAIAGLTVVEGMMSERWGDNRLCAYCVTLLNDVPKQIGSWTGTDSETDKKTQEVAGARGYISRMYSDGSDGVAVWLIVGHARDTARHTPDVCYGSQGNKRDSPIEKHTLTLDDGTSATFFTAVFLVQSETGPIPQRVYWTWFKPEAGSDEPVNWIAPDNVRMEIGAAPALFKLYFTETGAAAEEEGHDGPAMQLAREFLPTANRLLRPANGEVPAGFDASTVESI